jgi:hypothetical protein
MRRRTESENSLTTWPHDEMVMKRGPTDDTVERRCVLLDRPCASTLHCAARDVLVAAQDGMLATLEAASVQDIATPARR